MKKVFVIVLFFLVGGMLIFLNSNQEHQLEKRSLSQERIFWKQQLNTLGEEEGYREFIQYNTQKNDASSHFRAHILGELLFSEYGISAITTCDASFGFGCYHGLFTTGLASEGDSFITKANNFCVEEYGVLGTGCQHGIGHGIVEYVGQENIHHALELCKKTAQPTSILGCTSGVFMEHNTPFTTLADGSQPPPYIFTEENPFGVCTSVSDDHKESCYYELGGWWEAVLSGNTQQAATICARESVSQLRNACARGIGQLQTHMHNYNPEKVSDVCNAFPENIQTECFIGAAWGMYSHPDHKEKANAVCVLSSNESYCSAQYDFANLERYGL